MAWGRAKEIETHRRIKVLLWAYAYEIKNDPLVDDHVFDSWCMQVDLGIDTNRPDLDTWFRKQFHPCTGQWIHDFPELDKLARLYETIHFWQNLEDISIKI